MKKGGNGIKRGGGESGRGKGIWIGEGRKGKTVVRGDEEMGKGWLGDKEMFYGRGKAVEEEEGGLRDVGKRKKGE